MGISAKLHISVTRECSTRHAFVCAFLPGLSPPPDLTLSTDAFEGGLRPDIVGKGQSNKSVARAREKAALVVKMKVIRLLKAITALRYLVFPF